MPLRRWTPLGLLALMAVAALLFSLTVGSASLSMAQLWGVVQGQGDTLARTRWWSCACQGRSRPLRWAGCWPWPGR